MKLLVGGAQGAPCGWKLKSADSLHWLLQSADFGAVSAVNTFSRSARWALRAPHILDTENEDV